MGTRLALSQRMNWDPDHEILEMLPWKDLTADQKAKILASSSPGQIIDEYKDNGWGAVAKSFYEKFLTALKQKKKFAGADTPVYAVGYDWRQSCAKSGNYLATRIDR